MTVRTDTGVRLVVKTHARGVLAGRGLASRIPAREFTISKDALSVSTNKDYSAVGGYALSLFPRAEYLRFIRPDDWIEVYGWNEMGEELLLWGPVDTCERTRQSTESGVQTRVSITGQDFTKVLLHTECFFDPLVSQFTRKAEIMDKLASLIDANKAVKAGAVVKAMLELFLGTEDQFLIPGGKNLLSVLNYKSYVSDDTDGAIIPGAITISDGNLWSLVQHYSDPLNNFVYTDLRRKKGGPVGGAWEPILALGRLPYDRDSFNALPGHVISCRDDVRNEAIGFHDNDVRNWFRVHPELLEASQLSDAYNVASGASVNKDSIERHGIRRFEPQAPYCTGLGLGEEQARSLDSIRDTCDAQADQIANWYVENEFLLSGTYTTRFLPQVRVGQRLVVEDEYTGDRLQFFIESVNHSWNWNPPMSSTTIRVTRGTSDQIEKLRSSARDQLERVSLGG